MARKLKKANCSEKIVQKCFNLINNAWEWITNGTPKDYLKATLASIAHTYASENLTLEWKIVLDMLFNLFINKINSVEKNRENENLSQGSEDSKSEEDEDWDDKELSEEIAQLSQNNDDSIELRLNEAPFQNSLASNEIAPLEVNNLNLPNVLQASQITPVCHFSNGGEIQRYPEEGKIAKPSNSYPPAKPWNSDTPSSTVNKKQEECNKPATIDSDVKQPPSEMQEKDSKNNQNETNDWGQQSYQVIIFLLIINLGLHIYLSKLWRYQ